MPKVIKVKPLELYDSNANLFITLNEQSITLEHSLLSISKWESKWHKPFLTDEPKTNEELLDYIKCMTLTPNVNPLVYSALSADSIEEIFSYINDPMTATWFRQSQAKRNKKEIITSEVIYYLMISYGVPFECQKWHLNRLLTLIRVCEEKNAPPKKMGRQDALSQQRSLNELRRKAMKSKG